MGCCCPQSSSSSPPPSPSSSSSSSSSFQTIKDSYKTLQEVQQKLLKCGLESSNLIIGVDYTKSNEETGKNTFFGKNLHDTTVINPYMDVISIMGQTLERFDDDKLIPAFGFGDKLTKNTSVFPFFPDKIPVGFEEVLARYKEITPGIELWGPTNFAPLINEAIKIVKENHNSYHILLICTDGQVNNEEETVQAIVAATSYPLSIICVGVGDGPWESMHEFDDHLPARRFDNFQFVEYYGLKSKSGDNFEAAFALNALMEIPDQYKAIKKLKLLGSNSA